MAKIISEPNARPATQALLALPQGLLTPTLRVFPPISDDIKVLREIISSPEQGQYLGFDVEFRPDDSVTIGAVANSRRIYAAAWGEDFAEVMRGALASPAPRWVAHSGVSADKPIIEKALGGGFQTSLDAWDDSMLVHYLANQELVKAPDKDDAEGDGALGFMDLWTSTSLCEDVPNWKFCREGGCQLDGPEPCPYHEPTLYCGVDAWAGLQVFLANIKILQAGGKA